MGIYGILPMVAYSSIKIQHQAPLRDAIVAKDILATQVLQLTTVPVIISRTISPSKAAVYLVPR